MAIPALIVNGLLKYSNKYFSLPKGYYSLQTLFIALALVSLLRIKSLESVRYCDPGELGKLLGLDRIPEVRTLRKKVKYLSQQGDTQGWSKELAKFWMEENPELAGTLYVDGHVRVYYGKQTNLPKRYVSREKLCLNGITDYWVNDALGQPFFVITQTVNSGLLSVLRKKIIPKLLDDVPMRHTEEDLKNNPYLFRMGIVFDREGYSPEFFKEMLEKRIVCYTYKKYVKDQWPFDEFQEKEVVFPNGEVSKIKLAQRGVYLKRANLWVREIRKLTESEHQTVLITTDYYNDLAQISSKMFSRWSQENFFKYMMQHFGIDRLIDYQVEKMDETIKLVNPAYREIDNQVRIRNSKLFRKRAEYGALLIEGEIEENVIQEYVRKKAELKEVIFTMDKEIETLKAQRKKTKKHILFSELPPADQFMDLKKRGKLFIDTIKMIAYRAETAMVNILRSNILKKDEARTLVRQIFMTDADIIPNEKQGILEIRIHNMTNPRNNRYVQKLCEVLNESEIIFPGTNLRLFYNLVSN